MMDFAISFGVVTLAFAMIFKILLDVFDAENRQFRVNILHRHTRRDHKPLGMAS